jgi:hypothetical protein
MERFAPGLRISLKLLKIGVKYQRVFGLLFAFEGIGDQSGSHMRQNAPAEIWAAASAEGMRPGLRER